uniref:Uncharacterized protein n=1 Tax=Cryptophlebia leucotreta granulosis virus TaxID=35254 RepID=A0A2H4ZKI7_GVCL|nr:hypothetical protein [Cryptophlebia leucotreta granulovirus]
MEEVFVNKNVFIKLAKQLDEKSLKKFKPMVNKIHMLIDIYCVTRREKDLLKLLYFLRSCNSEITKQLITTFKNNYKIYRILE